jgi:hypothetical protein
VLYAPGASVYVRGRRPLEDGDTTEWMVGVDTDPIFLIAAIVVTLDEIF